MADLGTFGTPRPAVEDVDTFGYFGETVRLNPELTDLDLMDFFEAASVLNSEDNAQASALLKRTFRLLIHVEDFDTFWATAKANRQTVEDLMLVVQSVVEAMTERPTGRPSGSPDGPSATNGTSVGGSPSAVVRRLEKEGRPSVALMVRQREESLATG